MADRSDGDDKEENVDPEISLKDEYEEEDSEQEELVQGQDYDGLYVSGSEGISGRDEEAEDDGERETSVYSFPRAGDTELLNMEPQAVIDLGGVSDDTATYPPADAGDGFNAYPAPDAVAEAPSALEAEVDEICPANPPDKEADFGEYPSADEPDDALLETDVGEDELSVDRGMEEEDENVTELVVLDPDHPMMAGYQRKLKEFYQKELEKITIQLREVTHESKKKEQERENIGVQLYGVQQDLARNQLQLEKLRDNFETTKHGRELTEQELADVRKLYREKQTQANVERKNNAELQAEVENINMRLYYMENAKDNVRGDIAIMKRAAEKAETDVLRAEENKRTQDLFVDRLNEKVAKMQEEIGMCAAQLAAQMDETKAAKEAVMEARMEIESITIEKKQLFQQWNSSLIGMKRRDEAHAAMLRALNEQQQQILTLETELKGFKNNIQDEQKKNEKSTLVLGKTEEEMNRARNNLNACLAKHEELKNEYSLYSRILKETEDALTVAILDKNHNTRKLIDIRKEIERAFHEKVQLEDEILETMRSQLTSDKAAQNTHKLIKRKRDEIRVLESKSATTENEISKILLQTTHVQSSIEALKKTLTQLSDELDQKNAILNKSEHEIEQRRIKIDHKKNELDMLNKKLEQLIAKAGGDELTPLEGQIKLLQKSIDAEQQQIAELQQMWLRDQSELVRLCHEEQTLSDSVETLKKELTVLTQKKLRIEGEITTQRREITDVEKKIHDVQNYMVRLDTLIHKETGTEDALANDNILRENEFMRSLKDAEKQAIEMQERLEALKEERERLLNSVVEAEEQLMLWEKKTQLARETRAAVDMDVGQGEIHAMKLEIHRMEVREGQLKREQEKLIQQLEKTVVRRDIITTRGEALAKSKMNFVTKGSLERQITDLKRRMKQTRQDISDCDTELKELKEHQEETSNEIDQHQVNRNQLQCESDTLEGDVERLVDQKLKYLSDIIAKQQKTKYYQQLKEGKYTRVCKSKTSLDQEYQKEMERMNNVIAIVDDLSQKYPHAQPVLHKVVLVYGSRPDDSS